MARLFLAFPQDLAETDLAASLIRTLGREGHEVELADNIPPGEDTAKYRTRKIQEADAFVPVVLREISSSQEDDLGDALRSASTSGKPLIIPVLLADTVSPAEIAHLAAVRWKPGDDLVEIARPITRSLNLASERRREQRQKSADETKKIEVTSATFIDETMKSLRRESFNSRAQGVLWYVGGFLSLLGGAAITYAAFGQFTSKAGDDGWALVALVAIKGIVGVGLLAACARYAFALGKSYTSEALKTSDRIHAIAFGRFYLQLYGTEAKWDEIKEAFQNWNIDRQSAFSGMDANQIDPKFMDKVVDLVNAVKPNK